MGIDHNIDAIDIRDAGKQNFLEYSGAVIVSRALPDARDGLKPVHRRILHAMDQLHVGHKSMHKKSARIVGDVIGKYHPHGDSAVYEAMVRMAQDFSMRVPLVEGQGNFGSIDGDNPAAMRYTEARMSAAGESCFEDIRLNTVNFRPNYDGSADEPAVLPLSFPNLVINGVQGIAVGMACNIPPHNPAEVMAVVDYMIEQKLKGKEIEPQAVVALAPGPDFPTSGIVHSLGEDYLRAWTEGSGRVMLRSRWHEENMNGRRAIVVTEIPYQVNKTTLIEAIVTLAKPNPNRQGAIEVEGIAAIRDETNKEGIRLVIEVKNGVEPELVFNKLVKMSQMEVSISYNATVLVNGRPRKVGMLTILDEFIKHRVEVIVRRTQALDDKASARLHILEALLKALDPAMLDKVIHTIRQSKDAQSANQALQALLAIDEGQAAAILEIKLYRLTGMQVGQLVDERAKLLADRQYYALILNDIDGKQLKLAREELAAFDTRFGNMNLKIRGQNLWKSRLSEINYTMGAVDFEAMVPKEMCGILLSERNYVRRVPIDEFNLQSRGTRGKSQFKLAEDDKLISSCQAFSHDYLLFFTEQGRVYAVKAYEVPDIIKGRFIANLVELGGDKVIQVLSISDFDEGGDIIFITRKGIGKRISISDLASAKRKNGVTAITMKEGDTLAQVDVIGENSKVMVLSDHGKALHFDADEIRTMGRAAAGVKAMNVGDNNVVGFCVFSPDSRILVTSERGKGSALRLSDFPTKHRGGMGVQAMRVSMKTGKLRSIMSLPEDAHMVAISERGVGNRIKVDSLRSAGRGNSGVMLMNIDEGDFFGGAFIWVEKE